MVDLNPDIYRLLKGICRVSLEFPSVREEFPVITITEVSNTSDYIVEGKEMISDVTYQIDVWDNGPSRSRTEEISAKVSDAMLANNYVRVLGRGFRDVSGLHRRMMYFKNYMIN